jgi:hypothetical protein
MKTLGFILLIPFLIFLADMVRIEWRHDKGTVIFASAFILFCIGFGLIIFFWK